MQFPSFKLLVWGKKRKASQSSLPDIIWPQRSSLQAPSPLVAWEHLDTSLSQQSIHSGREFHPPLFPPTLIFAGCHLKTFQVYIFIYNNRACCKARSRLLLFALYILLFFKVGIVLAQMQLPQQGVIPPTG